MLTQIKSKLSQLVLFPLALERLYFSRNTLSHICLCAVYMHQFLEQWVFLCQSSTNIDSYLCILLKTNNIQTSPTIVNVKIQQTVPCQFFQNDEKQKHLPCCHKLGHVCTLNEGNNGTIQHAAKIVTRRVMCLSQMSIASVTTTGCTVSALHVLMVGGKKREQKQPTR